MTRVLVIAGLIIAAVGALLAALVLPERVGHPVTPAMQAAAEATAGREVRMPEGVEQHPVVVAIFILPGCPCSDTYEPITHRIAAALQGQASVLGVVAGTQKEATRWQETHSTPYQVIADPEQVLIESCGAVRSAYTALIVNGRLQRAWPGFSVSMLLELSGEVAKATSSPRVAIPITDVPTSLTSGCLLEDATR